MSLLGVTSTSTKPKKSSSFLSRIRGSGGVASKEVDGADQERTGLRSLMHTMSKESRSSSDHLLFKDEDDSAVWEAMEKSNNSRVEIHVSYLEVVVFSLPERYERYRVPLHMIGSLKLSATDITFFWHVGDRREARSFKMEHPKKLYTKFFDFVQQRLKDSEEDNGGGLKTRRN